MSEGCPAHGRPPTVTRREFLAGLGAVAATGGTATAYARVAALLPRPRRSPSTGRPARLPAEQYRYLDLPVVTDQGTTVVVPPLHRLIVTARLRVPAARGPLQAAQSVMERTLSDLEAAGLVDQRASGCGLLVGWGLGYFSRYVAEPSVLLPFDLQTSRRLGRHVHAVTPARRFPSDLRPDLPETVLEDNEVVVIAGSDDLGRLEEVQHRLFSGRSPLPDLLEVTSVRRGFVDGRHVGTGVESLPHRYATAAGLPQAGAVPPDAELLFGFTSTQQSALAPSRVPSFETVPGFTDQYPHGYFLAGTALSLSHLTEDLELWYSASYEARVAAAFSPRAAATVAPGTETVPTGLYTGETLAELAEDAATAGVCGHSSVMQPANRLAAAVVDRYGTHLPAGTPLMLRADVNTLDDPFAPGFGATEGRPTPGLHFVAYTPTSAVFDTVRLAMDGVVDGVDEVLPTGPFTGAVHATHRQNFLVPSRAHRCFPLAELL